MKLAGRPWRFPSKGPMTWDQFGPWFLSAIKDQFRYSDPQDESQGNLAGRDVALPTLMTYIGDTGRAASQKLIPMVNAGGKLSTQSTQPLTATDAGSDASINVASHSVQFGSGVGAVSYNSGSITGLAFSTVYYVYADDPTYAGGAVTYLATTNANTATANDGRYYVGKVTTPANGAGDTGGGYGGGGGGGGNPLP